ncbi:MAG: hypothetical protein H6605_05265 [Flavobacteriales bacterium]|nr:hypothetical protein [Flavobacteriales bacterium]
MKNLFIIFSIVTTYISCKDYKRHDSNKLECIYSSRKFKNPVFAIIKDSFNYTKFEYSTIIQGRKFKRIHTYKRLNEAQYELLINNHFSDSQIDSIYVLSFLKKDTTFDFEFDYSKYESTLPKGWNDWEFVIKKIGHRNFKLTKNHKLDSNFKEEFYFDENFFISSINLFYDTDTLKFINKNY